MIYRLAKGLFLPSAKQRDKFPERPASIGGEDLVEDPYCHTYVPISDAYKASLNGKTVYFCSKECFEKYKANINENTKMKN
ncbi:MAG: hypothetical protein IMF10_02425 [Proteobacteria bacterium]|nr:hypothetical protein [Pseudomonadota bacterium]